MDANSFLMGGAGAPTAKFPTPGTTVGGRITEPPKVEQQRDIKTGEQKFWNNGDPMMQLVVTIQTEQRDPSIEDDDGKRRVFIKGQMKNAVADAVRAVGGRGLEVGGILQVRYTHDGQVPGVGMSPPKQYEARYTPAATAQLHTADGTPATVNTTTGEMRAPAPAAVPAPAPAAAAPQDAWDAPPF